MKIILARLNILIIMLFCVLTSMQSAPMSPYEIAIEYSNCINTYCRTKDKLAFSMKMESLCSKNFRVVDDLIVNYADRKMEKLEHYDINDYEMCIMDLVQNGCEISISNITLVDDPLYNLMSYGNQQLHFVTGNVNVSGKERLSFKEMFVIKNNEIHCIKDYNSISSIEKAIDLCLNKQFQDSYDMFENVFLNSKNDYDKCIAADFCISLLYSKAKSLKYDSYVSKYKLSRMISFRDNISLLLKYRDFKETNRIIENDKKGNKFRFPDLNYDSVMLLKLFYLSHDPRYFYLDKYKSGARTSVDGIIPYETTLCDDKVTKGYNYLVFEKYRSIERMLFPKVQKGNFGFVDDIGDFVIPAKYKFAYPFDAKHGLALVQNQDGGWGYIDEKGIPRTNQDYAMAHDIFVNGKTYVIKNGCLKQIDTDGTELTSVYGYSDMGHLLQDNKFIAIKSVDSIKYELLDIDGKTHPLPSIDLLEKERDAWIFKGGKPTHYSVYKSTNGVSLTFKPDLDKLLGERIEDSIILQSQYVDLGLSVKWASRNLGATSPIDDGICCGWGDPTGKINPKIKSESSYGGKNPLKDISGTSFDVVTTTLGKEWRLPRLEEWKELKDKCTWKLVNLIGKTGYLVTGPNGKSIFIGFTTEGYGCYWSSTSSWDELLNNYDAYLFRTHTIDIITYIRSQHANIRPVYIK